MNLKYITYLILRYRLFFIILTFLIMSWYSYQSLIYIVTYSGDLSKLQGEYQNLITKREHMLEEVRVLQIRVNGLKEETLNLDILSEYIKDMHNFAALGEVILIE